MTGHRDRIERDADKYSLESGISIPLSETKAKTLGGHMVRTLVIDSIFSLTINYFCVFVVLYFSFIIPCAK